MGTRGPVPNRSDQRRRRNKDGGPITRAAGARRVSVPAVDRTWHPIARRWYLALRRSGQSAFYEPSDWAQAYFIAESMSRLLSAGKFSAQLFAAVDSASQRLMTTEGDRRRLRLELEREQVEDPDEIAGVASMEDWRDRLAAEAGGG